MKILTSKQIREADEYTIQHEPVSSLALMERAASACCKWIENRFSKDQKIKIFCGSGNNGGDGLAIGRMLLHSGYPIDVYLVQTSGDPSPGFFENKKRLEGLDPNVIHKIATEAGIPFISGSDIVVDAIFGSGLNMEVKGIAAKSIEQINASGACVISIDIPSGLYSDRPVSPGSSIVEATVTLTFQLPKLTFMFPGTGHYAGDWELLDIHLDPHFIRQQETTWNYFTHPEAVSLIRRRLKFSHKGNYGHAFIISGSKGKMGAAVMAARACLRSGVGLLTVHVPDCGVQILQTSVPEAMVHGDAHETIISGLPDFSPYSAIAIGPRIGTDEVSWEPMRHLLYSYRKPLLLDADALNILSHHPEWMEYIPENSILTPHPKEFARLTKEVKDDFERFELQIQFSKQYKVYVVLKGAHTCIACPDGTAWFNSSGNPGMAKGGSGDVLTGIIAGLMAQGYKSLEAAQLGVFVHGLAGDEAARIKTQLSMTATDIVKCIPLAFQKLTDGRK
ncbi:MAG TPA: NAD(P)H-hydrate dehydratase [Bacteroidia bacterium]|nr:NAD(P)H-hydrate dehydratase [Bacteroidia bacterium]